uniref:DBC1/CARP1 catalytically inactive NUDIX hydrolase domain-containing protein n=1 Tax=Eutreptiella gymnastica TaxID=73025 RepID=A0A7S1I6U7_9EUGL
MAEAAMKHKQEVAKQAEANRQANEAKLAAQREQSRKLALEAAERAASAAKLKAEEAIAKQSSHAAQIKAREELRQLHLKKMQEQMRTTSIGKGKGGQAPWMVAKPAALPAKPPAAVPAKPPAPVAPRGPVMAKVPMHPLPWVEQLGKIPCLPWNIVNRPYLDLRKRYPGMHVSQDIVSIDCHFAPKGSAAKLPVNKMEEGWVSVDKEKEIVVPLETPGTIAAPTGKHIVKVAMLCGGTSEQATMHKAALIKFVTHNIAIYQTKEPNPLPECEWDESLDGKNPNNMTTLKKTAVRCVKTLYGADLSKCKFHRFMDIHYRRAEGDQTTTILIPELWTLAEAPVLGRQVKKLEQEVTRYELVEEPKTEAEMEATKKAFEDQIARQRVAGQKERPGERELDRVERLEKLEESLKEMEKNPPEIKKTKMVKKEIKEKKEVTHLMCGPELVSLASVLANREVGNLASPYTDRIGDTRLFAAAFHEMIKLDKVDAIIAWLHDYKAKYAKEIEERETKRKRDFEEMSERTKIIQERSAKKQKREKAKKEILDAEAKAEAECNALKEAERAEKEQELAELKQKNAEALAAIEKEEEEVKANEEPLPKRRVTKFEYVLDEAMVEPFLYFDMQMQGPILGKMTRNDLVQILHCGGEMHCQREVLDLVKATTLELPGITKSQSAQHFYYKKSLLHPDGG